jgi:hypothetical protein
MLERDFGADSRTQDASQAQLGVEHRRLPRRAAFQATNRGCYRLCVSSSPRRFRLLLVERETGHILNQAGRPQLGGQPRYEPSFDTETDALTLKDDLLTLFPWAEVFFSDAMLSEASATRFSPPDEGVARFAELVRLQRAYLTSPVRRVFRRPPPDPWDPGSYPAPRT